MVVGKAYEDADNRYQAATSRNIPMKRAIPAV